MASSDEDDLEALRNAALASLWKKQTEQVPQGIQVLSAVQSQKQEEQVPQGIQVLSAVQSQGPAQSQIEELSFSSEFDDVPVEVQRLFQQGSRGRGFERGRGRSRGSFVANPNVIVIPTQDVEETTKPKATKSFFMRPQDKWAMVETNSNCSSPKEKDTSKFKRYNDDDESESDEEEEQLKNKSMNDCDVEENEPAENDVSYADTDASQTKEESVIIDQPLYEPVSSEIESEISYDNIDDSERITDPKPPNLKIDDKLQANVVSDADEKVSRMEISDVSITESVTTLECNKDEQMNKESSHVKKLDIENVKEQDSDSSTKLDLSKETLLKTSLDVTESSSNLSSSKFNRFNRRRRNSSDSDNSRHSDMSDSLSTNNKDTIGFMSSHLKSENGNVKVDSALEPFSELPRFDDDGILSKMISMESDSDSDSSSSVSSSDQTSSSSSPYASDKEEGPLSIMNKSVAPLKDNFEAEKSSHKINSFGTSDVGISKSTKATEQKQLYNTKRNENNLYEEFSKTKSNAKFTSQDKGIRKGSTVKHKVSDEDMDSSIKAKAFDDLKHMSEKQNITDLSLSSESSKYNKHVSDGQRKTSDSFSATKSDTKSKSVIHKKDLESKKEKEQAKTLPSDKRSNKRTEVSKLEQSVVEPRKRSAIKDSSTVNFEGDLHVHKPKYVDKRGVVPKLKENFTSDQISFNNSKDRNIVKKQIETKDDGHDNRHKTSRSRTPPKAYSKDINKKNVKDKRLRSVSPPKVRDKRLRSVTPPKAYSRELNKVKKRKSDKQAASVKKKRKGLGSKSEFQSNSDKSISSLSDFNSESETENWRDKKTGISRKRDDIERERRIRQAAAREKLKKESKDKTFDSKDRSYKERRIKRADSEERNVRFYKNEVDSFDARDYRQQANLESKRHYNRGFVERNSKEKVFYRKNKTFIEEEPSYSKLCFFEEEKSDDSHHNAGESIVSIVKPKRERSKSYDKLKDFGGGKEVNLDLAKKVKKERLIVSVQESSDDESDMRKNNNKKRKHMKHKQSQHNKSRDNKQQRKQQTINITFNQDQGEMHRKSIYDRLGAPVVKNNDQDNDNLASSDHDSDRATVQDHQRRRDRKTKAQFSGNAHRESRNKHRDGGKGSKDALSAKIKKIQKKNDEILKRRKEVEQDKKKYGQ